MKKSILLSVLAVVSLLSMSSCASFQKVYDCDTCDAVVYKEGVATGQMLFRQDSLLKFTALAFRLEALNNYANSCRGGIDKLTREDIIVLKNVKDMLLGKETPAAVQSNNPKDWNHRISGVDFGDSNKNLPISQRVKNVLGYIINISLEYDKDMTIMGEIHLKKDNCMLTWICDDTKGDVWALHTYRSVRGENFSSQTIIHGGKRVSPEVEQLIDKLYKEKVQKK